MIRVKNFAASAILAVAGLALTASMASATTNLVQNGSFETPGAGNPFSTLSGGSTAIAGWVVGGDSIDYIGNYWQSADGSNYSLDLNGLAPGSIGQQLTGLVTGKTYTVSYDLAGNPAGGPAVKSLNVFLDAALADHATFDTTNTSLSNMGWTTEKFSFTATGSSEFLNFVSDTTANSGNGTYPYAFGPALDNVVIAVPEPATWAMLLVGFGAVGFAMRGARKSSGAAVTA